MYFKENDVCLLARSEGAIFIYTHDLISGYGKPINFADLSQNTMHYGTLKKYSDIKDVLTEETKALVSKMDLTPQDIVFVTAYTTPLEKKSSEVVFTPTCRITVFTASQPNDLKVKERIDINQPELVSKLTLNITQPSLEYYEFNSLYDAVERDTFACALQRIEDDLVQQDETSIGLKRWIAFKALVDSQYLNKENQKTLMRLVQIYSEKPKNEFDKVLFAVVNAEKLNDMYDKLVEKRTAPTSPTELVKKLNEAESSKEVERLLSKVSVQRGWFTSLKSVNDLLRSVRDKESKRRLCFRTIVPQLDWENLVIDEDSYADFIRHADSVGDKRLALEQAKYLWKRSTVSMQNFFCGIAYHLTEADLDFFYLSTIPYLPNLLDQENVRLRTLEDMKVARNQRCFNHLTNDQDRQEYAKNVIADETSYFLSHLDKMSSPARDQLAQALAIQLPKSITNYTQFERLMWFSRFYPVGQHTAFQALAPCLSTLITSDNYREVSISQLLEMLQTPTDCRECLIQTKHHLPALFNQTNLEEFKATQLPHLKLLALVADYKFKREQNKSEYFYFGLFSCTGAFSRTKKLAAAQALIDAIIEPEKYPLKTEQFAALKQGRLGLTIKSYLKSQNENDLEGFLQKFRDADVIEECAHYNA